jgi:hypothetical protein
VLPVVRHDVSRAGFQGAGDDRVVVAIASDEIDGICPFHDLGVGQGPDEALDLRAPNGVASRSCCAVRPI